MKEAVMISYKLLSPGKIKKIHKNLQP